MQLIRVTDASARIQIKPALSPLRRRTRVPCNRQRLNSTIGKRDQILLKRINAKGVADLEVVRFSVGAFSVDEVMILASKEFRCYTGR